MMLPSGPPTPVGGSQSVSPSLRSNSAVLGGAQAGSVASQQPFSSLSSPHTQFNSNIIIINNNNMGLMGNISNVSSLRSHSFGNGGPDPLSFTSANQDEGIQDFQQHFLQDLQSVHNLGSVKTDPQQLQSIRSLGPVKLEHHNSDSWLYLQQQQQHQQQHFLQISRESSQAAAAQMNLLQQQRMLRQQQILKTMSQQRTHLQQQLQQGPLARPQGKPITHQPGMCARRLTHYMYHQQHRPEDNNIEFWRKFVAEYFAPNAKKRWCVSLYGIGRQTTGVFPQDGWQCEICNRRPGRGFETTAEVLPRLFQIKYASGTLEELLYVDMPREYQNASGQIVLDYAKAVQESVLEKLRVVREGQLRIVFSLDLKICSWEFCATARHHEELIPRRLLIPQVNQLGAVLQKYQNAAQNDASSLSAQDLQNACNSFLESARQLAKALEAPLVNDLGYSKRYVRCLQISEVINSMKDLIDYSRETGTGPINSLINFPRRTSATSGLHAQQPEEQQIISQNPDHIGQNSINSTSMQLASASNGVTSVNNSLGAPSPTSRSPTTVAGSSNSLPLLQPNPSSPNNNVTPASHGGTHLNSSNSPANMSTVQQQTTQPHEADPTDSRSSVQKILQAVLMSPKLNGVSALGNEMKGVDGLAPALNGGNYSIGNGRGQDSSFTGKGFRSMGGIGSHATPNGLRASMTNRSMSMNGRVGMNHIPQDPMAMNHQQQQQDMGNRMLGGIGSANSFSNLQFDRKPSPY